MVILLVGEQGMVDEAQKALEEAETLKKVAITMFTLIYYVSFTSHFK